MSTQTKLKANIVPISKKLVVFERDVEKVSDKLYKLRHVTLLTADKNNALVKAAIANFHKLTFTADDAQQAADMMTVALSKTFQVTKKRPSPPIDDEQDEQDEVNAELKAAAQAALKAAEKPSRNAKPNTTKTETETTKKAQPKEIATFTYFCENSSVKCLPLSPVNETVVKQALKYFTVLSKTSNPKYNPTAADNAVFHDMNDSSPFKCSLQLSNRSSIMLLLTEVDAKDKPVCQILLKPLYLNPCSILCVSFAHKAQQPTKSKYAPIIDMKFDMTTYDAFQFHPHLADEFYTTAQQLTKNTNKVSFQFVNIVASDRAE